TDPAGTSAPATPAYPHNGSSRKSDSSRSPPPPKHTPSYRPDIPRSPAGRGPIPPDSAHRETNRPGRRESAPQSPASSPRPRRRHTRPPACKQAPESPHHRSPPPRPASDPPYHSPAPQSAAASCASEPSRAPPNPRGS